MSETLRVGGYRSRYGVYTTLLAVVLLGFAISYPLLFPKLAPQTGDLEPEAAPAVLMAISLVVLVGISLWLDSDRDLRPLSFAFVVIVANCAIRATMNPGAGLEFNYVLPFLAGMAAGAPMGFFVGAASCLISQYCFGYISFYLPGQVLVWGLAGLLGSLLNRASTRVCWIIGPLLGIVYGLMAGLLLNMIGWPTESHSVYLFSSYVPRWVNLVALLNYCRETSLFYDLLRGIATAIGLAILTPVVLPALRYIWQPDLADYASATATAQRIRPHARIRRQRSELIDSMWVESRKGRL